MAVKTVYDMKLEKIITLHVRFLHILQPQKMRRCFIKIKSDYLDIRCKYLQYV